MLYHAVVQNNNNNKYVWKKKIIQACVVPVAMLKY